MVSGMCIKIIDWVNYYMKIIYSASQYMHLNTPRTACLCIDTCSSKQTAIPPEHFAAAAIASSGRVSAWHRDHSWSRSLSLRRSFQGIVSQTIRLDASLCLQHSLHSMNGLSSQ